jgi:hypothetical protein
LKYQTISDDKFVVTIFGHKRNEINLSKSYRMFSIKKF